MPKLSPEQKIQREKELLERNSGKRTYSKKNDIKNPPEMAEPKTNEPAANTVEPAQNNNPAPAVENNQTTPPPAADNNEPAKEKDFTQPNTTYKPMSGATNDRSYATPQIRNDLTEAIPEPTFMIPKVDPTKIGTMNGGNPIPGSAQTAKEPILPPNPALNQATPAEKLFAAEQLADAMIMGYDKLHNLGRWYIKKSEEDLYEDHVEGKIDIQMSIPLDENPNGPTLNLGEFTKEFNTEVDNNFVLSQGFKDRVRPPLIRICEKNGWGMTDEQTLAFAVIEDLAGKTAMCIGMKKAYNKMYGMFAKMHEGKKKELEEELEITKAKLKAQVEAKARVDAEMEARRKMEIEAKHAEKIKQPIETQVPVAKNRMSPAVA